MITYAQNSDLPDLGITWNNSLGVPFDFSVGWTLQCDVSGYYPNTSIPLKFTKTTGITLFPNQQVPNIVLAWATTGEITTLQPGLYTFQLKATINATSKVRYLDDILKITPTI